MDRLTDPLEMTLKVSNGRKTPTQQQTIQCERMTEYKNDDLLLTHN